MKKLLLPLIGAVLAGLACATAASFVSAKKSSAAHAIVVRDSIAKHTTDSTAAADSVEKEHKAHEAEAAAAAALMTPADSIREAQHLPTTLKSETKGLPNAVDPKHGAPVAQLHIPTTPAGHDVAPAPAGSAKSGAAPVGKVITPRATEPPKPIAAKPPASVQNGLPENRIAKIFGAMQSKEAAKVLEQMSDSDVRVILNNMNDKQAAAILVALPAARAAIISKGDAVKPVSKADTSKPDAHKVDAKADSAKKPAGEHK